ncbi:MAG: hypothetical protein U1E87_08395 [Alphaproteobacteria bacterium]
MTSAYADAARVLIGQGAATVVLPEKIAILRPEWVRARSRRCSSLHRDEVRASSPASRSEAPNCATAR